MDRKIKDLIPLIAMALLIIGAIILLVVMNSSSDDKKVKENKKEATNVSQKVEINKPTKISDVSQPVATINDENTGNESENNVTNNEKSLISFDDILSTNSQLTSSQNDETKNVEKTDVTTETTVKVEENEKNTKDSNTGYSNRSYIESMVNEFLGDDGQKSLLGLSSSNTSSTTTSVTTSNTSTTSQTSSESKTNTTVNTKTAVAKSQPVIKQVTYTNVDKSVSLGSYVVSSTTDNKIFSAKSSSKNTAITVLDSAKVNVLLVHDSYIYAFENNGSIKKYSLVNGVLSLVSKSSVVDPIVDAKFTNKYLFVVTSSGLLYALEEKNSNYIQAGITRELDTITGITSVSGSDRVTITTTSKTYTYTFDGIKFNR